MPPAEKKSFLATNDQRIYEAARKLQVPVVNTQGDEPALDLEMLLRWYS